MAFIPEVADAVQELREAYPDSAVIALEDGSGGAFVTVDPVELGPRYTPSASWLKFQVTFQYPAADVYPLFIQPDVVRADTAPGNGAPGNGTPLGEGTMLNQYADGPGATPISTIQLSRRSNRLNPATDTAALKVEKVLSWLREL